MISTISGQSVHSRIFPVEGHKKGHSRIGRFWICFSPTNYRNRSLCGGKPIASQEPSNAFLLLSLSFVKKTQKTPQRNMEIAMRRMKEVRTG
jgi:hypothetical protein